MCGSCGQYSLTKPNSFYSSKSIIVNRVGCIVNPMMSVQVQNRHLLLKQVSYFPPLAALATRSLFQLPVIAIVSVYHYYSYI